MMMIIVIVFMVFYEEESRTLKIIVNITVLRMTTYTTLTCDVRKRKSRDSSEKFVGRKSRAEHITLVHVKRTSVISHH